LLTEEGKNIYTLTEKGRNEALEGEYRTDPVDEVDEERLGTTEYQQLIKRGKQTGVTPLALIVQTAEHIWNGGDYNDLEWVLKAMQEMSIRRDMALRWWHSWRSYLKQPIPANVSSFVTQAEGDRTGGKESPKSIKRDYILGEDDSPIFVGENCGDLNYEDAVSLARARAVGKAKGSSNDSKQQSVGSFADEVAKTWNAFQQMSGEKTQGKAYLMRPGEDGKYQMEEVDPNRPTIINPPNADIKPPPQLLIDSEGEVKEIPFGQPIVIKQPTPVNTPQYLIDRATGKVESVTPGQPIVIIQERPQPQNAMTPIQLTDKDGNPMVIDLSTFIKLEEHRNKQRRDDESHEAKMEITKGFKDILTKASNAVSHMAEE